jgi:hypothetical protein
MNLTIKRKAILNCSEKPDFDKIKKIDFSKIRLVGLTRLKKNKTP